MPRSGPPGGVWGRSGGAHPGPLRREGRGIHLRRERRRSSPGLAGGGTVWCNNRCDRRLIERRKCYLSRIYVTTCLIPRQRLPLLKLFIRLLSDLLVKFNEDVIVMWKLCLSPKRDFGIYVKQRGFCFDDDAFWHYLMGLKRAFLIVSQLLFLPRVWQHRNHQERRHMEARVFKHQQWSTTMQRCKDCTLHSHSELRRLQNKIVIW